MLSLLREVIYKRRAIRRAAILTAYRIYVEPDLFNSEAAENRRGESYRRGVRRRVKRAEHLGPELEELTRSARLRLLMPKAGDDVVVFQRHGIGAPAALDKRADNRRRALRAQGY